MGVGLGEDASTADFSTLPTKPRKQLSKRQKYIEYTKKGDNFEQDFCPETLFLLLSTYLSA